MPSWELDRGRAFRRRVNMAQPESEAVIGQNTVGSNRTLRVALAVALVGALVLGAVVVLSLGSTSSLTRTPPPAPLGVAFGVTNAQLVQCPSGATYELDGCDGGDYAFELGILTSGDDVSFGDVLFDVENSSDAVVMLGSPGGFSIVNSSGAVLATSTPRTSLDMQGAWTAYAPGISAASVLSDEYLILVDMGSSNPRDSDYTFFATGVGPYSGTIYAPLP